MNIPEITSHHGPFYEIKDANNTVKGHLLGSLHFFDEPQLSLNGKIEQAFNQAKALVVEVDVPKHLDTLVKECEKSPKLKESIIATRAIFFNALGFSAGVDQYLMQQAQEKQIPIYELESIEDQIKFLEAQADKLTELMGDTNEIAKTGHIIKNLVKAWKEGNIKDLKVLLNQSLTAEEKKAFIINRNPDITDKMDQYLKTQDQPFFVMGSAHLFGKNKGEEGVISLLRQKGWNVNRIKS